MDCFWQDTLFRYRRYEFRVGLDISWMFVSAVESSRSATQNKVSMSDPIRMICWVFFNSSREKREDSICYHPIRSHLLYLPAASGSIFEEQSRKIFVTAVWLVERKIKKRGNSPLAGLFCMYLWTFWCDWLIFLYIWSSGCACRFHYVLSVHWIL